MLPVMSVGPICALLLTLFVLSIYTSSIELDGDRLTKRNLFGSKSLRISETTSVEKGAAANRGGSYETLKVSDSSGKIVLTSLDSQFVAMSHQILQRAGPIKQN